MSSLRKDLFGVLREDSRCNLSDFSRKNNVCIKKTHYEFKKFKDDKVKKFVPVIDFESLGFNRLIVMFHDAVEGLFFVSRFDSFFVNNSVRLDNGLFAEYIFFTERDQKKFLDDLFKKNVSFDYFFVDKIIKQEEFVF